MRFVYFEEGDEVGGIELGSPLRVIKKGERVRKAKRRRSRMETIGNILADVWTPLITEMLNRDNTLLAMLAREPVDVVNAREMTIPLRIGRPQ